MLRSFSLATALLVAALPFTSARAELPTRTLMIGTQKLVVEIAATEASRETGLMNRFSLARDHGMLFIFDAPQPLAFWMKNTYVPLSIAFLDTQGRIVNIDDMRPQDLASHWSLGPAKYAIEMQQGWFAAKGITPGEVVKGLAP